MGQTVNIFSFAGLTQFCHRSVESDLENRCHEDSDINYNGNCSWVSRALTPSHFHKVGRIAPQIRRLSKQLMIGRTLI